MIIRFILIQTLLGAIDAWAGAVVSPTASKAPNVNVKAHQPTTRPVYRPKLQKVIAIDFGGDDETLEPQRLAPQYEKAHSRGPANIKLGSVEEQLKADQNFGTANDGKSCQNLASTEEKNEGKDKSLDIEKALNLLKRESAHELDKNYE